MKYEFGKVINNKKPMLLRTLALNDWTNN